MARQGFPTAFGSAVAAGLALLAGLTVAVPARAIVGPTADSGEAAAKTGMLLRRAPRASGFCSAAIVGRRSVLTAGHCAADGAALSLVLPGETEMPFAVDAIAVHPGYRADAVRLRQKSIDLALVRLAQPLPASIVGARLSKAARLPIGARVTIAGYGMTRDGDGSSVGRLNASSLTIGAPASAVLYWLRREGGGGACEGDSGGPVFGPDGSLVGIIDWAEGDGAAQCGALTQAAVLASQRNWIESVLKSWGER